MEDGRALEMGVALQPFTMEYDVIVMLRPFVH